jgi:pyrophosphate--fructose-6-phosphate 1-phosphotransferase
MGRTASHITLECALQTHPNMTFISEEVAEKKQTLHEITQKITDMICLRAKENRNYGVVLVPEGLIEFIPEVKQLIAEINALFSEGKEYSRTFESLGNTEKKVEYVNSLLTTTSQATFAALPNALKQQLLLDRDPHGNVQVSLIATEQLLINGVARELQERTLAGTFKGSFNPLAHFFGYEGRCSLPSNFDSQYCYALGYVAALLIHAELTGYMAVIKQLAKPVEEWQVFGVPLTMMMTMEKRKGKLKPVIKKSLVDLEGATFKRFQKERDRWAREDAYRSPGPIQFFGERSLTDQVPLTMS